MVGQAITPLTPSITGSVTSYAVSPALPAGLTLNGGTGVISGTPTAVAATAAHTVTASNGGGSTTTSVSITVKDVAPSVDYGSEPLRFTTGVPIEPIMPTVSGGAPVSWSIQPALPVGLAFDPNDGRITGTSSELVDPQSYLVTATNSGGQSQAPLTISVESGVLFDLGHASDIRVLRLTPTRALSQDRLGHWVLWNLTSAETIAQGDTAECLPSSCSNGRLPVDLAGSTVAVQTTTGLEIRAAADGHVLASIASDISSWKLASDGTYVVAASATGLRAWTPSGSALFTRAGDYSHAVAFAAPAEVRVARGAAGNNVIEELVLPSGAAAVSGMFQGEFASWFLDGERFLTSVGTTVRVYSQAVLLEDLATLPTLASLAGQGAWFWITRNGNVQLFAVGASATPTATYTYDVFTKAVGSGTQLAIISSTVGRVRLVDLATATPTSVEYDVPHGALSIFGANAGGQWLLGNSLGVVLEGSTLSGAVKYFGYGAALSVAGSDTRTAIATASRRILYFNAATKALEGTIAFDASDIELKSDGSVLVAMASDRYAQYFPDRSLKVYALPSATLLHTRPYTYGSGPALLEMSLARSGEFLAETLYDSATGMDTRQVTAIAGGSPTFSNTVLHSVGVDDVFKAFRLSPDGSLVAITSPATKTTDIYENGSLVGAAQGWAVGWLDDEQLLLNRYGGFLGQQYLGATISDESGATVGTPPLASHHIRDMQPLGSDLVYSPRHNWILSLVTGAATWTGSRPADGVLGAVAGPRVVFVSGSQVRAEPH